MNRITCDEVFEALTRAPFPSGSDRDGIVEEHIRVCHDCRQLAEALRPATDLFAEVVSAHEKASLPTYRGRVTRVMRRVREDAITAGVPEGSLTVPRESRASLRRGMVPSIVVGVLLLIAVIRGPSASGVWQRAHRPAPHGASATSQACLLAGFGLPAECLPRSLFELPRDETERQAKATFQSKASVGHHHTSAMQYLAACRECHAEVRATLPNRLCCTNCHAAMAPKAANAKAKEPFPRLSASCKACHS